MIIFSDVDGTIYDYQGKLPQSTVFTIRKIRENSHKVLMVTGRSKAENKKELWDIGFDGMIGGYGSYVEVDDKVLFHQTLTINQCKEIIDWFESRNIEFYEESNNGLFPSKNFLKKALIPVRKYVLGKGTDEDTIQNIKVEEVLHGMVLDQDLIRDDLNKISFILNSYQDYLDAKERFKDLSVGTWGGKDEQALFGDIGIKDVDKGRAIQIVLDYLNIDKKDTIAIGDASNDIGMLEYCNIGLTFNSAGQEIKKIADYISDDVDKDGFYKAFKHLGLV